MILDILTVLFLVLGFALLFWMIGERRRDVLHYVTEPSRARAAMPDSSGHVTSGQPAAADLRAQTSLTKLPRVARYTEGESEMSKRVGAYLALRRVHGDQLFSRLETHGSPLVLHQPGV